MEEVSNVFQLHLHHLRITRATRRSTKYAKYIFILRFLIRFSLSLFSASSSSEHHPDQAMSHRELSALSIKCTRNINFSFCCAASVYFIFFRGGQPERSTQNSFKINTVEHSWIASRLKTEFYLIHSPPFGLLCVFFLALPHQND